VNYGRRLTHDRCFQHALISSVVSCIKDCIEVIRYNIRIFNDSRYDNLLDAAIRCLNAAESFEYWSPFYEEVTSRNKRKSVRNLKIRLASAKRQYGLNKPRVIALQIKLSKYTKELKFLTRKIQESMDYYNLALCSIDTDIPRIPSYNVSCLFDSA
jgi:hypothetical protein